MWQLETRSIPMMVNGVTNIVWEGRVREVNAGVEVEGTRERLVAATEADLKAAAIVYLNAKDAEQLGGGTLRYVFNGTTWDSVP